MRGKREKLFKVQITLPSFYSLVIIVLTKHFQAGIWKTIAELVMVSVITFTDMEVKIEWRMKGVNSVSSVAITESFSSCRLQPMDYRFTEDVQRCTHPME